MKFKIKYADKIVGIFTIIGLLSISVLLIFMGINQRWFATNYYYNTKFLSADGIKVGMPIKYKGFQIGQIDKIRLSKTNEVEVDFYIYGEYIDVITPNTIIQKSVSPIGLGSDILIHPGLPAEEHIPENSFILSYNLPEAKALIDSGAVVIAQGDSTITNIINQINPVLSNLTFLLDSINKTLKGEGDIPAGKIIKNVEGITADLDVILSQMSGRIEKLLTDIQNMAENLSKVSTNLSDPNNSVTAITTDNREIYNQIDEILKNLNNTMTELNNFAIYINESTPQLTGILEEGRGALKEGTAVMEGLKNNPLLRKGITQQKEQTDTQYNRREEEF